MIYINLHEFKERLKKEMQFMAQSENRQLADLDRSNKLTEERFKRYEIKKEVIKEVYEAIEYIIDKELDKMDDF